MLDEDGDGSMTSDLGAWETLLSKQTELFRKTSARNAALAARVEELERELQVWKVAFRAEEEEKHALAKTAAQLERSIGALKDDNPLAVCLIDGDGNIFSEELLAQGHAGGRRAAALLTQGLSGHVAPEGGAAARAQLWLTVYCNKRGLSEALVANGVCTTEQFEAFVLGFNQAAPLFSFVDVGSGKEAADAKIKECLRVFTRFPQTSRVFFGGAHDNGYTTTLNHLHNEGLQEKLVILRGYKDLAKELKSLDLPEIDIEGLFMSEKMQHPNYNHNNNKTKKDKTAPANVPKTPSPKTGPSNVSTPSVHGREWAPPPQDFDKFRNAKFVPEQRVESPAPNTAFKSLTPGLPLHKHRPAPCNFFYLGTCRNGPNCRYAHDYRLYPQHIEELRANSKKWPCPYANTSRNCPHLPDCCMAHKCPRGPKCGYAKNGKCKFTGSGMHDAIQFGQLGPTPINADISSVASSPPQSVYDLLSMSPTPTSGNVLLGPRPSNPYQYSGWE